MEQMNSRTDFESVLCYRTESYVLESVRLYSNISMRSISLSSQFLAKLSILLYMLIKSELRVNLFVSFSDNSILNRIIKNEYLDKGL